MAVGKDVLKFINSAQVEETLDVAPTAKQKTQTPKNIGEDVLAFINSGTTQGQPLSGEQMPMDEEPEGFIANVKDMFTGESKMTPEMESLPGLGNMPELNQMSMASLKSAFNTMTGDPGEAVKALKVNFPNIEEREDSKGNLIVKSGIDGKDYKVNEPGLDSRDIIRGALIAAMFPTAGGSGGLLAKMGAAAATQGGIEALQYSGGGTFDFEQIPMAGATELIAPGIGGAIKGGRGVVSAASPAANAARAAVDTAESIGIPQMTSDVFPPKSYVGKLSQSIGERIPFTGTGAARASQQEARANAVREVARDFGGEQVAAASDDVMADLLATRGSKLEKYVGMKNDVINRLSKSGVVDVTNSQFEIEKQIRQLKKLKTKGIEPIIGLFNDYKDALKDQTIDRVDLLRKQLGDQLKDPGLAGVRSTGEKALSKIYGALKSDMGDFIKNNGEKRDFVKWQVANAQLRDGMKELEVNVLKSALDKGEATPEMVKKLLFSQKPSDVRLLSKNLSEKGRASAKAAIMQDVIQKSGGIENISPEKFISTMSKPGIAGPANVFFDKRDKDVMAGLMKALQSTRRAGQANVKTSTGAELTTFVAPSVLTSAFGLSGGLGGTAALGLGARLYESVPVRNALIKIRYAEKGKEAEALKHLGTVLQTLRQQSEGEEIIE